ncbi:hypothetical protein EJ06DRAFT_480300, partial [Trichodelitschia bisporula]
ILADLVSQLSQLRELRLEIETQFSDKHIERLAINLPSLEKLHTGGHGLTDQALMSLSTLNYLKRVSVEGSRFTFKALMAYILSLGPMNNGMSMTIVLMHDDALTRKESRALREALHDAVNGHMSL